MVCAVFVHTADPPATPPIQARPTLEFLPSFPPLIIGPPAGPRSARRPLLPPEPGDGKAPKSPGRLPQRLGTGPGAAHPDGNPAPPTCCNNGTVVCIGFGCGLPPFEVWNEVPWRLAGCLGVQPRPFLEIWNEVHPPLEAGGLPRRS